MAGPQSASAKPPLWCRCTISCGIATVVAGLCRQQECCWLCGLVLETCVCSTGSSRGGVGVLWVVKVTVCHWQGAAAGCLDGLRVRMVRFWWL